MQIINHVKSLGKSDSEITKKLKSDLVMADKYFGTLLLLISCVILECSLLQFDYIINALCYKQEMILLVYISSVVVYCLIFLGAWVFQINNLKVRMILILLVSVAGVIEFWRQSGNLNVPVLKIAGTVLIVVIIYAAVVLSNTKAHCLHGSELHELRNDICYVPDLLGSIQSLDLKKRIANEVYSYVYGTIKYKRRYYIMTSLSIILPALVTAITSSKLLVGDTLSIVISILSMLTVIVTGIMSSMKAKESWIRYRKYLEYAKQEIFSCVMGLDQYAEINDVGARELHLAEKLEKLYGGEQDEWKSQRKDA